MGINDNNYFQELFIDEAKAALNARGQATGGSTEDVNAAIESYVNEFILGGAW